MTDEDLLRLRGTVASPIGYMLGVSGIAAAAAAIVMLSSR